VRTTTGGTSNALVAGTREDHRGATSVTLDIVVLGTGQEQSTIGPP
jgi:hypothetical protein